MTLKLRPTGLGSGIDKDRHHFEPWRVNSPFSVLAGRTRVRQLVVRDLMRLGSVASCTRPH